MIQAEGRTEGWGSDMEGWLEIWGLMYSLLPPLPGCESSKSFEKHNEGSLSSSAPLMHEGEPETCSPTRRGRSSSW